MAKGLRYDGEFIVGGRATTRVTPNFRLSEFQSRGGALRVNRELVASLQSLRDGYGRAISVKSMGRRQGFEVAAPGMFAWLGAASIEQLLASASELVESGEFAVAQIHDGQVYVEVPSQLPPMVAAGAFEMGMRLTAAYETSGDPYLQVTGNFDGAGLSFGPIQVNFGTGTLSDLMQRFHALDAAALEKCFQRPDHYHEWQRVVHSSRREQIAWADGLSRGRNKHRIAEPWNRYLQNVGQVQAFRDETVRYAYDVYGRKLVIQLAWLKGLSAIRIDHFACLSALYDCCVQQGGLEKAQAEIRRRVERENPQTQHELVHIAVEERGRRASRRWRADCISRRLGILYRDPVRITESGFTAYRDNPRMYLVRNATVRAVEQYLS